MKSFSEACDVCGTVNGASYTHCLACGLPLSVPDDSATVTSTPPFFFSATRLLKQRYLIIRAIGQGGMGTVYIGKDTHLGDRLVAIKEMSQSGLSPSERLIAAKNFKREAHLLAGLEHPHLPSIYDHFAEDQRWYLVMSFVKGQTLADYLVTKNGKLPVREVLEIGIVVCDVLNYLHTHQPPIIFRDVKPSNIMRTVDGHIYLIDFGVARFFKPGKMKDTRHYGTSGYAPPEQYGSAQTTPRSDIYSLGVTLYELLSGYEPAKTPFHSPPLEQLSPTAPPPLVTLITQMLDLDEKKRPQTAGNVKQELKSISSSFNATPSRRVSVKKNKQHLLPLAIITSIIVLILSYLLAVSINAFRINTVHNVVDVSKANTPNIATSIARTNIANTATSVARTKTPYGIVDTFCNALNSETPDFHTAYNQLSSGYQHDHSLINFQEYLQGTSQCIIVSPPDGNNQAGINLTMSCPPHPPPPGMPPPPNGPPPPTKNPVDLTLIEDGSNGWKIDTIYVVGHNCGPPPPPPN